MKVRPRVVTNTPLGPCCLLNDLYLLLRQAVEFMDELVDLPVGGLDLALKAGFLLWVTRG